jgi:Tfp pilus assembly protein PilX
MNNFQLSKQHGVTLITALIMLVLLTLMVLVSADLGNSSLQSVGNMQQRSEVYSAAQETVEQAISSTAFYKTPTAPITDTCNGQANTKCIDTNGDGNNDVAVTLANSGCLTAQEHVATNFTDPQEITCVQGQDQNQLSDELTGTDSACWDTVWELKATAKDMTSKATVVYTQGVAVTVSNGDTNSCK